MALSIFKCNHLTPLHVKGFTASQDYPETCTECQTRCSVCSSVVSWKYEFRTMTPLINAFIDETLRKLGQLPFSTSSTVKVRIFGNSKHIVEELPSSVKQRDISVSHRSNSCSGYINTYTWAKQIYRWYVFNMYFKWKTETRASLQLTPHALSILMKLCTTSWPMLWHC